jgi:uncharacterized protein (TIGR00266 family)
VPLFRDEVSLQIQVRHNPSFAVARATMAPGETVRAEAGSMMASSGGVTVEAQARGGLKKSLKRSVLGGESFFITTFTAPDAGGWVDCAARLPGDIVTLDTAHGLNLTQGSFLCSDGSVEIDTNWGGFKSAFGGEGGFMLRASGVGHVACACYGALDQLELAPGEQVVLDSGHLVAFTDGITFTTRKASKGLMNTLKSGEGLVMEFTGPGHVWSQTRNPSEFIDWLTQVLPFSRD